MWCEILIKLLQKILLSKNDQHHEDRDESLTKDSKNVNLRKGNIIKTQLNTFYGSNRKRNQHTKPA